MILGKRLSFLQGGPLHIQVQRPDLSEEKGTEMRRKSGGLREKNGGIRENAGGRKFQMTLFGGIVLVGLLVMTVKTRTGAEAVLFNKNSEITLYAKATVGAEPVLNAAKFFPDEKLDPAKFSYDLSECDFNTPGTYRIPVYYGQEETDCVIQLEVYSSGRKVPETTGSMSGDSLRNGTGQSEGETAD